jgi:hypothetical protein
MVFIADFIGSDVSNNFRVREINLNNDFLTAYGGYENGVLQRTAIVNLIQWNTSSSNNRPTQQVNLNIPNGVTSVLIKRLQGAGTNVDSGLTWAGMQWTYAHNEGIGEQVGNVGQTVTFNTGQTQFSLTVDASEAIQVVYNR